MAKSSGVKAAGKVTVDVSSKKARAAILAERISAVATSYDETEEEAPRFIIPGILPVGLTILSGAPKAAKKSTFAIDVALALTSDHRSYVLEEAGAHGEDLNDYIPKDLSAMMLCLEMSPGEVKFLSEKFIHNGKVRPGLDLAFINKPFDYIMRDPNKLPPIVRIIEECEPDFLVIDTFARSHTLNENDPAIVNQMLGPVQKAAMQVNCAVLLIHHTRKTGQNRSNQPVDVHDEVRGTSAIFGEARGSIVLVREVPKGEKDYANVPVKAHCRFRSAGDSTFLWYPDTIFDKSLQKPKSWETDEGDDE